MKVKVVRDVFSKDWTQSKIYVDDVFVCYGLEDRDRALEVLTEAKVYGKTAIPRGNYKTVISMSNRFKKLLPELLNVPHFTGIRIHSGNTVEDTEGCILVGTERTEDGKVLNSRVAFTALFKMLNEAYVAGEEIRTEVS
jgi:hypothetical protein